MKPNYSNYTITELYETLDGIDKEAYPDRVEEIHQCIDKLEQENKQDFKLNPPWIAGFWQRIFALVLDTVILGIAGFVLGTVFEQWFIELGGWAKLVGFAISLVYFGLMNSAWGKGQTPGKRILGIKVVTPDNQYISPSRSFLRYGILGVPLYLNGATISSDRLELSTYVLAVIVFGGIMSTIYLYLFNTKSRQCLHDILLNTVVVNSNAAQQNILPSWKIHFYVTGGIFAICLLLPALMTQFIGSATIGKLLTAQQKIVENPVVNSASMTDGTTIVNNLSGSSTTHYISTTAVISENRVDDNELAKHIATIIMDSYPEAMNRHYIIVSMTYGYDIGIWSQWSSFSHQFTPEKIEKL